MNFLEHDQFSKEIKKLAGKYRQVNDGLAAVKLLLERQFDPSNPEEIIAPGKIHRVYQDATWSLWKVEVILPHSGLKPNQWPRMWFAVSGDKIVFLCIATHMQNYGNNSVDDIAVDRASDYF